MGYSRDFDTVVITDDGLRADCTSSLNGTPDPTDPATEFHIVILWGPDLGSSLASKPVLGPVKTASWSAFFPDGAQAPGEYDEVFAMGVAFAPGEVPDTWGERHEVASKRKDADPPEAPTS